MLAITPKTDTYLPADELGITEAERRTLIVVRNDLASGRIVHTPSVVPGAWDTVEELAAAQQDASTNLFNMALWVGCSPCGTAHCIGGFMEAHGCDYSGPVGTLWPLFYPGCGDLPADVRHSDLTPAQAVRAIDAWATGHQQSCWALALSDA